MGKKSSQDAVIIPLLINNYCRRRFALTSLRVPHVEPRSDNCDMRREEHPATIAVRNSFRHYQFWLIALLVLCTLIF